MGRDQQQSNPGANNARAQGSGQQQQQNQASRQPQQNQGGSSGRQQGGLSGEQGSGASRQPQQFDSQSGQQGGGAGQSLAGQSSFAQQIQPRQNVVDADGHHLGTVDHLDGDRIKLARADSNDGQHHYVEVSQVAGIEGGQVRLRERGDNDFGIEAGGTTGIS